jgi:hypothetical protein
MTNVRVGDEIVIDSRHEADPRRVGEILEIRDPHGVVHYRVRWDDGRETLFYPSSDAHIVRARAAR